VTSVLNILKTIQAALHAAKEQFRQKFDELQDRYNKMEALKTDLSTQFLVAEDAKLRVSLFYKLCHVIFCEILPSLADIIYCLQCIVNCKRITKFMVHLQY